MSYPILYSSTETNFDHNGIGILSACVSCEVTEEANGIFELAMQYPMDGIHYEGIADRAIIKAKSDQFREPQLFRVYAINKPLSGIVTVLAEHISYDLSGIPVKPFSASNAPSALSGLKSNAVVDCQFEFWTDKETVSDFKVSVPASIRSRLGGVAGSILDVYGGEYEFDNYVIKLHNNRGMNRGVSIRYGKNLTDVQQEQNCSNVVTGIYPYWEDSEGQTVVELPERIVNAPGTYNFVKIRTLDLSREFETKPTEEQLRNKAERYIDTNEIGVPNVSLTVSFAQLEQYEEYKNLKLLERVSLFDTVNVEFPALNVSSTAKAVKLVYDVIADRVKSVTLGSVRANIADTIVEQQQEIQKAPTKTDLERAKEAATAWLTNGKGYEYKRRDENGMVIETFYLDTPDIETAVNVLRIGQSGIGFSHNGINGPYESAWTIDGRFNADWIDSGTLYGLLFKAGVIESLDGKIKIDLSTNSAYPVFNTGISTNGMIVRAGEENAETLFQVQANNRNNADGYFADFFLNSANGTRLFTVTELFSNNYQDRNGVGMYCYNQAHDKGAQIYATESGAGIKLNSGSDLSALGSFYVGSDENSHLIANKVWLKNGDSYVGSFLVGSDGNSALTTTKINGKPVSWKTIGGVPMLVGDPEASFSLESAMNMRTFPGTTNANGNIGTGLTATDYRILDVFVTDADGAGTYLCNKYINVNGYWTVNITDVADKTIQANKDFTLTVYYMTA